MSRFRGGVSQVLRGGLGLAFPWLLMMIPADKRITGPVVMAGVAMFIVARVGSLFEPETLRRAGGFSAHVGEALFVTLALLMGLMLFDEAGYVDIGLGWGALIVIVYFLAHAIAMPILTGWRGEATKDDPPRPMLRRVIYAGAFVAEEGAALLCIALAVHTYEVARQGPWGLWDITPVTAIVVLGFFYLPLVMLESAAHPGLSEDESWRAAFEGALLQLGAVLVAATTGAYVWL